MANFDAILDLWVGQPKGKPIRTSLAALPPFGISYAKDLGPGNQITLAGQDFQVGPEFATGLRGETQLILNALVPRSGSNLTNMTMRVNAQTGVLDSAWAMATHGGNDMLRPLFNTLTGEIPDEALIASNHLQDLIWGSSKIFSPQSVSRDSGPVEWPQIAIEQAVDDNQMPFLRVLLKSINRRMAQGTRGRFDVDVIRAGVVHQVVLQDNGHDVLKNPLELELRSIGSTMPIRVRQAVREAAIKNAGVALAWDLDLKNDTQVHETAESASARQAAYKRLYQAMVNPLVTPVEMGKRR
jgi:hypothetical protein